MSTYDWTLSNGAPPCVFSVSFYFTARDAIFRQLTTETTPEQFQAGQESLQQLRDELVQQLYAMHYSSLVGSHRCVDHLYREARARLRSLEIMQPIPFTIAPPPHRETPANVVRDLRDAIQPNQESTMLGTDDPIEENRHPR